MTVVVSNTVEILTVLIEYLLVHSAGKKVDKFETIVNPEFTFLVARHRSDLTWLITIQERHTRITDE